MKITDKINEMYGCEYCKDRDKVHECKHDKCPYADEIGKEGYEKYVNNFENNED